jgi:F-type H+-transporting ATPase subunit delta
MLRTSVRSFIRTGRSLRLRYAEAGEGGAAPALLSKDEFKKEWKNIAPNLDMPRFPGEMLPPRPEVPSSIPEKVTFNFYLPHDSLYEKQQVSRGDLTG